VVKITLELEEPDCLSPDEINAAEERNDMQQQQEDEALLREPGEGGVRAQTTKAQARRTMKYRSSTFFLTPLANAST
jgi:hypothetical protein